MFGFFKKRNKSPSEDELLRLSQQVLAEVSEKWLYFHNTFKFKTAVPLAKQIDLFAQPLSEFFQNEYPQLLVGGSEVFWITTFTAILESGTHPKEEVNAAIAQLRGQYAGKR